MLRFITLFLHKCIRSPKFYLITQLLGQERSYYDYKMYVKIFVLIGFGDVGDKGDVASPMSETKVMLVTIITSSPILGDAQ